ncbi:MAG TPA: ABC transporter permease [Bryobacteraceae bacterium]|nr:ABC transporter permease [Bryobacteraceae bacterium]
MHYRHILRRLMRAPGFTAIAVVTLALGIGANSALFSVIDGVLLKPLPYPHPEDLIGVWHNARGLNLSGVNMAPALYFTYREQNRSFTDIGMWDTGSSSITGLAEPEQVDTLEVTAGTLPLLEVPPALGRWFSPEDDLPGTPETAILMYGYWQARFGGDRSVVGRTIMADGRARQIIGVMPERFRFLDLRPSVILPMQMDRGKVHLGNFSYQGVARLKPGVTMAQASADLARLIPIAIRSFPAFPGMSKKLYEDLGLTPFLRPLEKDVTGTIAGTLWLLMGSIGMVLLIACANVANLLLVRAGGRQQELAIRAALGAGRKAIAWELIAESLTLGLLGGVAGLGLAYGGLRLLMRLGPANLPRLAEISIDGWVLLFTLAISLAAGLLFGAIPVWKYAGPNLSGTLRGGGRTSSQSRERHRARGALVVVQVALALVLLVSSGLMIRSFQALRHVEPGFTHPERVETLRLSIPEAQVKYETAVVRMEHEILDRLAAIPGVESAGLSSTIPLDNFGWHDPVYPEGRLYTEGQMPPLRRYRFISPGVLNATGTRLVAGRDFTWTDVYGKRPLVLVSENLARELWGTPAAALGKRLRESPKTPWQEVIGVVQDEYEDGLDQTPSTTVFWPVLIDQFGGQKVFVWRSIFYVIRGGRTGTQGFLNEIQQAVWSVNPSLPLANVRTLRQIYEKSLARTSFTLVMLAIAGAMALLLGMVGIYGVIAYSVEQRTREIGIRMALGAPRSELTRLFLRQGLRLALIGVACGLLGAVGLTRLMARLLFAVKPVDPVTYAAVAACLIAAALAASYLPALRISAIDPVDALRAD